MTPCAKQVFQHAGTGRQRNLGNTAFERKRSLGLGRNDRFLSGTGPGVELFQTNDHACFTGLKEWTVWLIKVRPMPTGRVFKWLICLQEPVRFRQPFFRLRMVTVSFPSLREAQAPSIPHAFSTLRAIGPERNDPCAKQVLQQAGRGVIP